MISHFVVEKHGGLLCEEGHVTLISKRCSNLAILTDKTLHLIHTQPAKQFHVFLINMLCTTNSWKISHLTVNYTSKTYSQTRLNGHVHCYREPNNYYMSILQGREKCTPIFSDPVTNDISKRKLQSGWCV